MENYEQKYKDALEAMKDCIPDKDGYVTVRPCDIFPELVESDDEKIRKDLIEWIKEFPDSIWRGHYTKDVIAWLEKQGDTNETIDKDKIAEGVLRGAAITLITWIDYNAAEGNMCLSNMECKDIEDALVNGDWNKIYGYMKKKLEKQDEKKEYTFKSLPRLLDMVEPTERARAYCQKLINALIKEGYATDAKIVGECLKQMNGEKVALATMDEKQDVYSSNVGKYFISPEESLGISTEEYNEVVSDCIMSEPSEPKTTHHEGWVNIFKCGLCYSVWCNIYPTKEDALNDIEGDEGDVYITTIKIEWEEQQ